MKKLITFAIILVFNSGISGAAEVTLDECRNQGREHGNHQGIIFIDPFCESLTFNETTFKTRFDTGTTEAEGHGFANLIYLVTRDLSTDPITVKNHIITGEQSRLESIHSIKVDKDNKVLTVLANDPPVVFNFRWKGGNVASTRTLENEELLTATNIEPINDLNLLAVFHMNDNKITFYNRFADKDGRVPEFETNQLAELNGAYTELNKPVDGLYIDGRFFVYNQGNQKLLGFDLPATGDQSPAVVHDLSQFSEKNVVKMIFDETSNKILFFDEQTFVGDFSLAP